MTTSTARDGAWFPGPSPAMRDGALRLFCFPFAGAGASVFSRWAEHLPVWIEARPVQLPGRESRLGERPLRSLAEVVGGVTQGMLPLLDRPYAIYGHSVGGLLAYAVARALCAFRPPTWLFIGGRRAPDVASGRPSRHLLNDEQLVAELRRLGGTPPDLLANREWLAIVLPILRADLALSDQENLSPSGAVDFPITVFAGDRDEEVCGDELEGWRRHTSGRFEICRLPGGHFFLSEDRVQLLGLIRDRLTAVAPWAIA